MNEALCAGLFGGLDDRKCAGDIAGFKPGFIRCIDHSGNVQDHIGASAQICEARRVVQRAAHPCYTRTIILLAPCQGARIISVSHHQIEHPATDKSGRAGDRDSFLQGCSHCG